MYNYWRPRTTTKHEPLLPLQNVYHYRHPNVYGTCTTTIAEDPVDVKFLVVTPNTYRVSTTTKRERLLPLRLSREQMHVLYEMHVWMLYPPVNVSCFPRLALSSTRGNPVIRDHPTILHDSLTSHFLLHRYLHELSGPECCRGTISVSPPWHPFLSATVTNASCLAHVNIFIKIA